MRHRKREPHQRQLDPVHPPGRDPHHDGRVSRVPPRRPTGHDIEDDQVRRVVTDFGATEVAPEDVYGIDADIFSCG